MSSKRKAKAKKKTEITKGLLSPRPRRIMTGIHQPTAAIIIRPCICTVLCCIFVLLFVFVEVESVCLGGPGKTIFPVHFSPAKNHPETYYSRCPRSTSNQSDGTENVTGKEGEVCNVRPPGLPAGRGF